MELGFTCSMNPAAGEPSTTHIITYYGYWIRGLLKNFIIFILLFYYRVFITESELLLFQLCLACPALLILHPLPGLSVLVR